MCAKPLVLITESLADPAAKWLSERCRAEQCSSDSAQFASLLKDASGLIVRTYTNVNDSLLDGAANLRVVGRAGVGIDNINLPACRERGIKVVYTPDANTQAVVEYVFRLLLETIRPTCRVCSAIPVDEWRRLRAEVVGRRQLDELTLGILGLGRIGNRVARLAHAFGMRVIYHDIQSIAPESRQHAEPVGRDSLFKQSDVLSVHIDGRPENRNVVGKDAIDRMKHDVVFLNTSRGFVVDHAALARFLREHPSATALIDVHEPEPITEFNPLLNLPNAQLYPHLAGRTDTALLNMSWVVRDVWRVLQGEKPQWEA